MFRIEAGPSRLYGRHGPGGYRLELTRSSRSGSRDSELQKTMPETFSCPAAWRGDELLAREDWLTLLGPTEIEGEQMKLFVNRETSPEEGLGISV